MLCRRMGRVGVKHLVASVRRYSDTPIRRDLTLHLPSKLLLQLPIIDLNHRGPAVRTTVWKFAGEQILNQLFHFGKPQIIVRFDGMTANRSCNQIFAHSESRGRCCHRAQLVDQLSDRR